MFGTIIMDAYSKGEERSMSDYLDEICSPRDSWGWSSAGIYSFWDYNTKEILYIGLASDLSVRYKQHNGLLTIEDGACKYLQIQEYFKAHTKLGYSVLVQSPLSQPIVHRSEKKHRDFINLSTDMPISNYAGVEGLEHIRTAEGQLIESYKIIVGDIPPWNKIGGDIHSRKHASHDNYQHVVMAFSQGTPDNWLVSRCTVRELAGSSTYAWFETLLHGLRITMLTQNMSFDKSIEVQNKFNPYFQEQWDRIIESNYLNKKLVI
ncbi:MAG TPA: hypothetical protein VEF53_14745 [Patescibacteria group bacterium]|nr:hypothetical protein [Patescibacteria group bacterium]